ncbi:hypothetical protein ACPMJQ_27750 [Streptomyces pseudogriseolus]|uniref:hypothetical protein n=1 Tax=Streptomyces pseudogriseolus TaxID=36817 RepID=UPI003FA1B3B3
MSTHIPVTLSLAALSKAYARALKSFAYYTELRQKVNDPAAEEEARFLLLGWGEVWDLFAEIGLPVGDVDSLDAEDGGE